MKTKFYFVSALLIAALAVSCGQEKTHREAPVSNEVSELSYSESVADEKMVSEEAEAETPYEQDIASYISSSAAVENSKDTSRLFIRTANLRFKVKSVIQATLKIESITAKMGGYVSYTSLNSPIDYTTQTAVSADSVLETSYYTVVNTMVLRVPSQQLDSTLKAIAPLIDYLDTRTIQANDVRLTLFANRMAANRTNQSQQRLQDASDKYGKRLRDVVDTEDAVLSRQEQTDRARIANLQIMDQIKYSTITLNIYQRQSVKRELVANEKNIEAYQPGFGSQLWSALKTGWNILASFLIFLAKTWGILLFLLVAFVGIRQLVIFLNRRSRAKKAVIAPTRKREQDIE